MTGSRAAAALYDNKDAQRRTAAKAVVDEVEKRHQREAAAHRESQEAEVAHLADKHAAAEARYGHYRPPGKVLAAHKQELVALRATHKQRDEQLEARHERELQRARGAKA
jgi:hypothetical protein